MSIGHANRHAGRRRVGKLGARRTHRVALARLVLISTLSVDLLLGGCGALSKLSEVGRPPALTPTADPTKEAGWRPLAMPMPAREATPVEANALWHSGSRAFFKDQRASQVGDVITVVVDMTDSANLQNGTTAARTSSDTGGMPALFGLQNLLSTILPKPIDPSSLVSVNSTNSNVGAAQIQRSEAVTLRLAGVVTQVLPNGNLVVAARQEIEVNSELRVLMVTGVVRPQDIASDNTVTHDRMAEARISYGGKGQLTDVQTPRWGQQMMDIVLPF
jgi:flagellar L-ring protein precursor FlgH